MVEYMSVLRLRSRNSVGASSSQTLTQETWQRILPHPPKTPTTEIINDYTSLEANEMKFGYWKLGIMKI